MVLPVGKRGGARRSVKGKPRPIQPFAYFLDKKAKNAFPKKLGQYRFLICTDLSDSNLAALMLFTAWIKINENWFDARNQFPIYGFIVKAEHGDSQALLRTWEFLREFSRELQWNDPDHHFYQLGVNTADRVWTNGEKMCYPESADLEMLKVSVPESEMKTPAPLENGMDEIMSVGADNLFVLQLCKLNLPNQLFEKYQSNVFLENALPPITFDAVFEALERAEAETLPHLVNYTMLAFNQTDELSVDSTACRAVIETLMKGGVITPKDRVVDIKLIKNMLIAACKILS